MNKENKQIKEVFFITTQYKHRSTYNKLINNQNIEQHNNRVSMHSKDNIAINKASKVLEAIRNNNKYF